LPGLLPTQKAEEKQNMYNVPKHKKENRMRHVSKIVTLSIAGFAIAAACASTPLQTDDSTSGIRAAEEVGAAEIPNAALHLQLAKEELESAKGLADRDEKEMAESMLLRAEADAELAVLLSREDAEKTQANLAMERVRTLQKENK
jgi:hypothetical protein